MKLSDIFKEQKVSGELTRVRKLFVRAFKSSLASRSREVKLDFVQELINDTLSDADIRFLRLRLLKGKK